MDSFPISVDNHSSYCVTHKRDDFIGKLQPMNAKL